MKAFPNFLAAFALLSNSQFALAETINPPKQEISLMGSPFAVTRETAAMRSAFWLATSTIWQRS